MEAFHQMNVLLVAEESAGVQALRLLSNSAHNIAGVLTTIHSPDVVVHGNISDEIAGSGNNSLKSSVAATAENMGVPVLDAKRVQDAGFTTWIASQHIDVLLNVHSLYRICPEVIQEVQVGAFNLHPGPLPGYSGLNIPSWAVYNEETTHAVTLHHITEKIDAGDIVYESQFPLTLTDTGLTVSIKCVQKGMLLIERLLNALSREPLSIPSRPQTLSDRTFYKRNVIPVNGYIEWSAPAHKIDAYVRACNYSPFPSPWGEPKTRWGNSEISILKTTLSNKLCREVPGTIGRMIDGKTAIATADHWLLIDRCKVDGDNRVAATFLNQGDLLTSSFK
ncbi:MAG: formyltransferase family protein [Balneolaceae bacterium]